ncbi:MAG: nucleotide sugar dehydrogenase [Chlamydiales bacterium]|nr:nucleotide sugar dehydrogenase [Chlamydiales bacterium]
MKQSQKKHKVPIDYQDRKVCILGLGFVGLTLAISMADVGFQVIGVEIRDDLRAQLQSGDPGFFEPGLNVMLQKVLADGSFSIHKTIPSSCDASVYLITVGTPLDEQKKINLSNVQTVSETIAEHVKDGDLVILRSTVQLGTSRKIVRPILEKAKNLVEVAFCPERTVEGQAMEELRYLPQIVGADELPTRIRASHLFQFLTPTVVQVSSLETAEFIKLMDNTKRDVSFGFSNEVAFLCDVIGISAKEVIHAGRFGYSRNNLPLPGPVAGPCLSKDTHILVQSMLEYGVVPEIAKSARAMNERQPADVAYFLKKFIDQLGDFPNRPIISLLGIAFKGSPATDDLRGTAAKEILEILHRAFPLAHFCGFDPIVSQENIKQFGVEPKKNLEEAFQGAHLVCILNNHALFSQMPLETLALQMARPGVIYDFWNNYEREMLCLPADLHYIALGSHKFAKSGS